MPTKEVIRVKIGKSITLEDHKITTSCEVVASEPIAINIIKEFVAVCSKSKSIERECSG